MLNNIIVDKLRISLPLHEIVKDIVKKSDNMMDEKEILKERKRIKDLLDMTLEKHLSKAFVTSYRHAYFRIEFNPTRYSSREWNDDLNLQMIPEEIFLRLFKDIEAISPIIIEKANVVELNLTKNILLNKRVPEYIDMLLNVKSAHGLYPISISSKGSKSLYFSSLASNYREKDYVGNRLMKFYDKTHELKFVKNKNLTQLKLREGLTALEKKKLGSRYSEKTNTINLDGANLLRVELTYLHNKQISKIAKHIGGGSKTKLDVSLMIDKLQKNELYKYFDEFFEAELKKFIFTKDIGTSENVAGGIFTQILPALPLGKNLNIESEMYYFANLLEVAGMNKNTVSDKLKTINTGIVRNEFYRELYGALFLNESVIPNKVNFDLYRQIQEIDKRNRKDGRIILSDDIFDEDEFDEDFFDTLLDD